MKIKSSQTLVEEAKKSIEKFSPAEVKELSHNKEITLIDLRANIFDILNLDFQKINSRDFFVDEFKGNLVFYQNKLVDVEDILLSFGT